MSKPNEAKKTIVPVVGMYLTYESADGITRPKKPLKVTLVDGASLKGRRHGSRRTSTVDFKTLKEFRLATPEEIAAYPVDEDGHDIGAPVVSAEAPRPTVAHEPPPPPAPEPAANDTTAASLAKVFASTVDTIAKQHTDQMRAMREEMIALDRARREDANAMRETLGAVLKIIQTGKPAAPSPAPVPPPAPAPTEPKDSVQMRKHLLMFESLVPEFVGQCLVSVDMRDPDQRARALEGNEAHKMFVEWCADGKRADEVPYEHAFYALMKRIPNAGHREEVKRNGKVRVLLPWAPKNTRQVEMFPEPPAKPAPTPPAPARPSLAPLHMTLDTAEVFRVARERIWANLDRKHTATIEALLKSGITKEEAVDALKALHALIGSGVSNYAYTPEEILNPAEFSRLVAYAKGGSK